MYHSTLFIPVIIFSLLISGCNTNQTSTLKRHAEHVILIGVDGMSPDGVINAQTPVMDALMKDGAHSFSARAVLPSSSGANWGSMLNGAGPEQHGILSNSWRTDNFILPATAVDNTNLFPSVFTVIRKQLPSAHLGAIYHWEPIKNFFEAEAVNYSISPANEEEATELSIDYITQNRPDFTFIHLDHVDGAGHGIGHGSPEYYKAVSKADSLIGLIVQATKDAGMFDNTIFIISSDHGGLGKGHGGATLEEVGIPWIISGNSIKPNYVGEVPINTYDSPATVLFALGLEIPYEWIGRPVRSVFKGEAVPKLMFRSNPMNAKPIILPDAQGYVPAGGLFEGGTAEMRIQTANPNNEIRYTLDGSLPTMESALYTEAVSFSKTTVVKAQLYHNGKSASQIGTAYFRVLPNGAPKSIRYTTYVSTEIEQFPDVSKLSPINSGYTHEFDLEDVVLPQEEQVAVVFESQISIPVEGNYRFYLASDDGSNLYVNQRKVVDNDGNHGVIEKDGSIQLTKGKHSIQVDWFNASGGSYLGVYIEGPNMPKQLLDPNLLSSK